MNTLDAINNLREAIRRGIPNTLVGSQIRGILDNEIERVTVRFDAESICNLARGVQHILEGIAAITTDWEADDKAAEMLDAVLDWAGCEE